MLKLLYPSDNNSFVCPPEVQIKILDLIKKTYLRFTDSLKLYKHSKLIGSFVAF
jgi:hypothetical protein